MIDIEKYLLVSYLDGGRSMAGHDCWGQMLAVREELGCRPLPSLSGVTRHTVQAMGSEYRSISGTLEACEPEAGAIAAVFKGKAFVHVGVVVDIDGRLGVLETNQATGPRWMRVPQFLDIYYKVIFYRDHRSLPESA
jgi:hypothetical protein